LVLEEVLQQQTFQPMVDHLLLGLLQFSVEDVERHILEEGESLLVMVVRVVVEVTMHQPVERLLVPIHLREVRDTDTHLVRVLVVVEQPELAIQVL
jgi:hypothetical protein